MRGTLAALPRDAMLDMLDRQSASYEGRLPKRPWTTGKMAPDALVRMMRMIVPCRLTVAAVDGTWKISQNKPAAARLAAADQVASGLGAELGTLSRLMRDG